MALDTMIREQMGKHVAAPREAERLWGRARKLLSMGLAAKAIQDDALELACYALQLSPKHVKAGRATLKDRAAQAAELLVDLKGVTLEEELLDRTTFILREMPKPAPAGDEAKVLADAVNLGDFGVAALMVQAGSHGPVELVEAGQRQQEYGYWEARLKSAFHFQSVREMAKKRLAAARKALKMLEEELGEDGA